MADGEAVDVSVESQYLQMFLTNNVPVCDNELCQIV